VVIASRKAKLNVRHYEHSFNSSSASEAEFEETSDVLKAKSGTLLERIIPGSIFSC
jgi:hypothetical protein